MIAYPVGYHLDVFTGKEPALENQMCFVNLRLGQATSGGPALIPALTLGRGGVGGGKFCWALLDWPMKRD
jgi:hypothetical protein